MEYNPPYGSSDPDAPYVDRSTPNATQGSKVPAKAVEHPQREIVAVIEAAGLTPDGEDTTQLLQALKYFFAQFPIYPECKNSNGLFDVASPAAGTVRVPAGIEWVMRGARSFKTIAAVDLPTLNSKTYHLRWDEAHGFRLRDLADVAYNPTSALETNVGFDTTYDDVLIAKVVTNGANVATITNLKNKASLISEVPVGVATPSALDWATLSGSGATLNWARKPQIAQPAWQGFHSFDLQPNGTAHGLGAGIIRAQRVRVPAGSITRYGAGNLEYWYEDDAVNDGYIALVWYFYSN
jgi:hypothetical protein